MGNCQAIDNASFVLQTETGRAERFYSPIPAAQIMKLHPGHYVALLLTTTLHHQPPNNNNNNGTTTINQPLRVTRIKVLRPTDNLVLGHAYRLISTQEVMKGLKAKKNGKSNNYKNFQPPKSAGKEAKLNCDQTSGTESDQLGKTHHQVRKTDKHQGPGNSKPLGGKPRGWHPSLNSISEASS
ncbi:uncharacterized protein LOC143565105 [Bidens hawaiensis]|uniref:uncharacterized protein LOC143565105 n=1 Tax=Bidens hawaiensis TaxID=980011 RepID=UPI004049A6EB